MIKFYDKYLFSCGNIGSFIDCMLKFEGIDVKPILKKEYGTDNPDELIKDGYCDDDMIYLVLSELPGLYTYDNTGSDDYEFEVWKVDVDKMFNDLKELFPECLNKKYYDKLVAMKV